MLAEQTRLLADEAALYINDTDYSQGTLTDWVEKLYTTITLSKAQLVNISMTVVATSDCYGAGRVRLGSTVSIISTGAMNNETVERQVILKLGAGSHTFRFHLALWKKTGSGNIKFDKIIIGKVNFADLVGEDAASGSVQIVNGTTGTLIDKDFTAPSARKFPGGTTKTCGYFVFVSVECENNRLMKLLDSGLAPSGYCGASIFVDDVQKSWSEDAEDQGSDNSNINYGEGAYGFYNSTVAVGSTLNIKVKVHNNTGATKNCKANVRIVCCVWICLPAWYEPFTLDFPVGSTLYVTFEPFLQNENKSIALGKVRAKSFGNDTDFYSITSATGILNWNYTFDRVKPGGVTLLLSNVNKYLGGCVGFVAVDMR